MIHFVLLQNKQGKTRFSKFFTSCSEQEQRQTEEEVLNLVLPRKDKQTNFLEYKSYRLIYRRYQALYFILCVDLEDNELMYLEFIHFLVECLDAVFEEVSELDLVYGFHRVYAVIDELILAGEIQETSPEVVLDRMREMHNAAL
ncbi:hypothetical protein PCE1_004597 [Barthelona sp. PCE]